MNSIAASLFVLAFIFGGALFGIFLRAVLPSQHLNGDSKDTVRLGMGLVGTTAALVLGLLIASAKASYDAQSNELTLLSANVGLLDKALAHYGPEAKEMRDQLRGSVIHLCDRMWPTERSGGSGLDPTTAKGEYLYDGIQRLTPKNESQRSIQIQALSYAASIGHTRWLMYAQSGTSVPLTLLVVLVLWFTMIFISYGLFAPRNATVLVALFVAALSVAGAMLLIMEMYKPFDGVIHISSAPLRTVLARLGQ